MLIAAAEEERFTRKKHDFEYPHNAVKFCLDQAGVTGKDLDHVVLGGGGLSLLKFSERFRWSSF